MYSLVSASVLALDLVRHPSGAAVADAVDRVLALNGDDVRVLATYAHETPERAAARTRLLEASAIEPRMARLLLGVRRTTAAEPGRLPSVEESRTLAAVLSETLLGGLGDLLALLGRESPLAADHLPAAGVQVALDAVTAAWAGRGPQGAHVADAFLLAAPWHAGSPLPPPLPSLSYGEAARDLRDLLEEIARLTPERWQQVEQAHMTCSIDRSWSSLMHDASRAAVDSGRVLAVARAQVAAARALRLAGVSSSASAKGGAMAVVAAVQGLCVRDKLDTDKVEALLGPWEAGAA